MRTFTWIAVLSMLGAVSCDRQTLGSSRPMVDGTWIYADLLDPEMTTWKIMIAGVKDGVGDKIRGSYRVGEIGGGYIACSPDSGYWCLGFDAPTYEPFFAVPLSSVLEVRSWVYSGMRYQIIGEPMHVAILGRFAEVILIEGSSVADDKPQARFWFSPTQGLVAFQYLKESALVAGFYEPTSFYVLQTVCGVASRDSCVEDG